MTVSTSTAPLADALYFNTEGRKKIQTWRDATKQGEWNWSVLSNAIIDYYDGLKLDPKLEHLWANAAYALHIAGFPKIAKACLERALKLNAKHPHVLEVLTRIDADYPFNEGVTRPNIPLRHFQQIDEYGAKILVILRRGGATPNKNIFIVHGHDTNAKWELKNFLTKLGLEPIVLHEMDGGGLTIIEKFEKYANLCYFAFVLLTPDDPPSSFTSHNADKRARPNVLMELGYFIGRLGRPKVAILRKGKTEIHSDILGIEYISIDNGVEAAGEAIRLRLRNAGFVLRQRRGPAKH